MACFTPVVSGLLTEARFGMCGGVDTHLHAIPPSYKEVVEAAGGDPSGFSTPEWSLDASIQSMKAVGSEIAILSVSTPGAPIAGRTEKARQLARTLNEDLASYTLSTDCNSPPCVGFFGALPDWQDVNGTLAEVDYLYAQQQLCNGVTVYTTYGDKLLGDECFRPIWKKLQDYRALVFIHPGVLNVTPKFIGASFPQPVVEYPIATTRTAVDLVVTGTMRACPDIDVILSHAGGTLPYLAGRIMGTLAVPEVADQTSVNVSEAMVDFARFYHDLALSTSPAQLDGLLDFTDPSHILFGSDFPYARQDSINAVVASYEAFVSSNPRGYMIAPDILRKNSITLLNKHALGRRYE